MVHLTEVRIVMPFTVEEFKRGQRYANWRTNENAQEPGQGGTLLSSSPYYHEVYGEGMFTHSLYRFGNRLPDWVNRLVPPSALVVDEKSWITYPYMRTVITIPFFSRLKMEVESVHLNDDGSTPNALGLSEDDLARRVIDYMDLGSEKVAARDYHKELDPELVRPEATGRGPLTPGWQKREKTLMCAYKIIRAEVNYWGLATRAEKLLINSLRQIFLLAHKNCFGLTDEWYHLSYEEVMALEVASHSRLNLAQGTIQGHETASLEGQQEGSTKKEIGRGENLAEEIVGGEETEGEGRRERSVGGVEVSSGEGDTGAEESAESNYDSEGEAKTGGRDLEDLDIQYYEAEMQWSLEEELYAEQLLSEGFGSARQSFRGGGGGGGGGGAGEGPVQIPEQCPVCSASSLIESSDGVYEMALGSLGIPPTLFCTTCSEFFCQKCFHKFHCTARLRSHIPTPVVGRSDMVLPKEAGALVSEGLMLDDKAVATGKKESISGDGKETERGEGEGEAKERGLLEKQRKEEEKARKVAENERRREQREKRNKEKEEEREMERRRKKAEEERKKERRLVEKERQKEDDAMEKEMKAAKRDIQKATRANASEQNLPQTDKQLPSSQLLSSQLSTEESEPEVVEESAKGIPTSTKSKSTPTASKSTDKWASAKDPPLNLEGDPSNLRPVRRSLSIKKSPAQITKPSSKSITARSATNDKLHNEAEAGSEAVGSGVPALGSGVPADEDGRPEEARDVPLELVESLEEEYDGRPVKLSEALLSLMLSIYRPYGVRSKEMKPLSVGDTLRSSRLSPVLSQLDEITLRSENEEPSETNTPKCPPSENNTPKCTPSGGSSVDLVALSSLESEGVLKGAAQQLSRDAAQLTRDAFMSTRDAGELTRDAQNLQIGGAKGMNENTSSTPKNTNNDAKESHSGPGQTGELETDAPNPPDVDSDAQNAPNAPKDPELKADAPDAPDSPNAPNVPEGEADALDVSEVRADAPNVSQVPAAAKEGISAEANEEEEGPLVTVGEMGLLELVSTQDTQASALMLNYKALVERLKCVDIKSLSQDEKLVFWINIYNALAMHGYIVYGIPKTHYKRVMFLNKVSYLVGDMNFSLLMIEHSVLRAASHRPVLAGLLPVQRFKPNEPAYRYALGRPEPLVTFALSCGSTSSPPVQVYCLENVREQLQCAASWYLGAYVSFTANRIVIPKLLQWYGKDLAPNTAKLLEWIASNLPQPQEEEFMSRMKKKTKRNGAETIAWEEEAKSVQVLGYDWKFKYILGTPPTVL